MYKDETIITTYLSWWGDRPVVVANKSSGPLGPYISPMAVYQTETNLSDSSPGSRPWPPAVWTTRHRNILNIPDKHDNAPQVHTSILRTAILLNLDHHLRILFRSVDHDFQFSFHIDYLHDERFIVVRLWCRCRDAQMNLKPDIDIEIQKNILPWNSSPRKPQYHSPRAVNYCPWNSYRGLRTIVGLPPAYCHGSTVGDGRIRESCWSNERGKRVSAEDLLLDPRAPLSRNL